MHWAATQVNVLSPEIIDIVEADVFHATEGSIGRNDKASFDNSTGV